MQMRSKFKVQVALRDGNGGFISDRAFYGPTLEAAMQSARSYIENSPQFYWQNRIRIAPDLYMVVFPYVWDETVDVYWPTIA
jgi:hypothetical protein